jgi:hypothetical protein
VANSTRKRILDYLTDTVLPLITTGAGYNFTLAKMARGLLPLHQMVESELPAVFVASADESRQNETRIHFKGNLQVFLVGYVKDSDGVPGNAQQALDNLIEDVTKALYQDPKLGGLAVWTEVLSVETDPGDLQSRAGFVMVVDISYVAQGTAP